MPDDDFEWGYAENILLTCSECNYQIAIETDPSEFGGGRCVECDERMESEYR